MIQRHTTRRVPRPPRFLTSVLWCAALVVDEELHADRVKREVTTEDNKLCVSFAGLALPCPQARAPARRNSRAHGGSLAAVDARMLRVSVNSFIEMTGLATKTLDAF